MKKMTAKGTYSLDPLTVLELRELAVTWGVAKSEVIRRAVHAALQQKDLLGADRQPAKTRSTGCNRPPG